MQDGLSLKEIQILKSVGGNPVIELNGKAKEISDHMGVSSWHISITHSKRSSVAFVIAER